MQTEPWWETNPATTPRQELGMVSPELLSRRTMINPLCVSVSICTSSAYFDAVARRIAKPQFGLSARVIHLDDDREVREVTHKRAFRDIAEDVERIQSRGYVRMITASHRFALPVQVRKFEAPRD